MMRKFRNIPCLLILVLVMASSCIRQPKEKGMKALLPTKNKNVLVNCYYYAPHNHSMLAEHIETDLKRMVSIGTDIVTFCLQEEQMYNWHQQRVRNFIKQVHDLGLKVHVIPNRWAGLLAGWLDGYSKWSIKNKDTWMENKHNEPYSNPLDPKVAELYKKHLKFMLEELQVDGIVWDEPRPFYNLDVFWFLDEMSAYAKSIRPEVVISIFAESSCLQLGETFLRLKHMDYLGSDGHIRSESHKMHRMKTTIFEAHKTFYEPLKKAGKKTFFLLEGQRHRDEDLQNYLVNLDKAFSLPMDHLMYYYSAHEMSIENEKIFNEATWKAVASVKGIEYKP